MPLWPNSFQSLKQPTTISTALLYWQPHSLQGWSWSLPGLHHRLLVLLRAFVRIDLDCWKSTSSKLTITWTISGLVCWSCCKTAGNRCGWAWTIWRSCWNWGEALSVSRSAFDDGGAAGRCSKAACWNRFVYWPWAGPGPAAGLWAAGAAAVDGVVWGRGAWADSGIP